MEYSRAMKMSDSTEKIIYDSASLTDPNECLLMTENDDSSGNYCYEHTELKIKTHCDSAETTPFDRMESTMTSENDCEQKGFKDNDEPRFFWTDTLRADGISDGFGERLRAQGFKDNDAPRFF